MTVSSQPAAIETDAKREALSAWTAKANEFGVGYTRWMLAHDRRLVCDRASDGKHTRIAYGRPCTIQQVAPPEQQPLKPGPRT